MPRALLRSAGELLRREFAPLELNEDGQELVSERMTSFEEQPAHGEQNGRVEQSLQGELVRGEQTAREERLIKGTRFARGAQLTREEQPVREEQPAHARQTLREGKHFRRGQTVRRRGGGGFVLVHPALVGLAVLALILGQGRLIAMTIVVMAIHEAAHIACARVLGVPIGRLCITPLGAALELDAHLIAPRQEALIAGAGPLASALTVAVAVLMTGRGLDDALLLDTAGVALALTLFNLLPAAPLDGGRLLHALLRGRLGERRALDVCGVLGLTLAVWLMACVLLSALRGTLPVMLMAAAISVYVLAAGEYLSDAQTAWQLTWSHRDELERGACLPVRVVAVDAGTPARTLLSGLRHGATTVFRVMDERMRCLGELSEAELLLRCMERPDAPARELIAPRAT